MGLVEKDFAPGCLLARLLPHDLAHAFSGFETKKNWIGISMSSDSFRKLLD